MRQAGANTMVDNALDNITGVFLMGNEMLGGKSGAVEM